MLGIRLLVTVGSALGRQRARVLCGLAGVVLLASSAAVAQTAPCPGASTTSHNGHLDFREQASYPIDLQPCQTVVVEMSGSASSHPLGNALINMYILNANGDTLAWNQILCGTSCSTTVPMVGSVPGFPLPGTRGPGGLAKSILVRVDQINFFGRAADFTLQIKKSPRRWYNQGGRSFAEAKAIETGVPQFGSVHPLDPGQFYKVRVNSGEAIRVRGKATGHPSNGAYFTISLFDQSQTFVRYLAAVADYGTVAFPLPNENSVFVNTGPSADFYLKVFSQFWPTHDFNFVVLNADIEEPTVCMLPGPASGPQPPAPPVGAGEPVKLSTGDMSFSQTDARVGELALSRSFNTARLATPSRFGVFGPGWNSTVDARLRRISPTRLELRDTEGDPQYYADEAGTGIFGAVLPYTLESWIEVVASGYRRVFRHGESETYNAAGRLVSTMDTRGIATIYTRDIRNRVTTISRLGRTINLLYPGISAGPVQAFTGSGAVLASYAYDARGALEQVTYPDGTGYRYQYNAAGQIAAVDDLAGQPVERHEYDTQGRAVTSEVAAGIEKLTFSYQGDRTVVTDALGRITTYELTNVLGIRRVSRMIGTCSSCGGGGGGERLWSYDAQGRVTSHRTSTNELFTYTYDPATDELLSETDSLQNTTRYTYDTQGRVLTRATPDGGLVTYTYVAAGPQTITQKVSATAGRTLRVEYGFLGLPERVTDPRGKVTTLGTNLFGDLVGVAPPPVDGRIAATTFAYDERGRQTAATDALDHTTTTTYDARDRVTRLTAPDGTVNVFTYDGSGRRFSAADSLGRVTGYSYDDAGRLESQTDPTGGVMRYRYDLMSRLTAVTDAKDQTTTFEYDSFDRLTRAVYPGGAFETFTYDASGRLRTWTDRNGVVATSSYDAAGRRTAKTYSNGEPATNFTYDAVGRLLSASNGTDTLTWTFDLAGQLLSEQSSRNASTVTYTYDGNGNRRSVGLDGQVSATYTYDDASRLTQLTRGSNVFALAYDNANRRTSLSYPNGVSASYGYDALDHLRSLSVAKAGIRFSQWTYGYDASGSRTSKAGLAFTEAYGYDVLYRLAAVDRTGVSTGHWGYSYDAVGNRLSEQRGNTTITSTYNEKNQLVTSGGTSYTYDANGNLTQKIEGTEIWAYEWNAEGRLRRVLLNGVEQARFGYDATGRRVEKVASGVVTSYIYDGDNILRQIAGASSISYIHGPATDEPLAMDDGSSLTYLHAEGLGSIVASTNAGGSLTSSLDYEAFGNPASEVTTTHAFTGREWDSEIGLYYFRARYYDPKAGRFISEDPSQPLTAWNLYAYVDNDPVSFVDPFGLQRGQIAQTAESYKGSDLWLVAVAKGPRDPGDNKCNLFVYDVLTETGGRPQTRRFWGGGPASAHQWADPNQSMGCWKVVEGPPQPGDVIAMHTGGTEHPEWAHVGIYTGTSGTASASTVVSPSGRIVVNDWGLRAGEKPTIRRCMCCSK